MHQQLSTSCAISWASQVALVVKNPPARDTDLTPGSGRSPGEGNGYPLQCSWLENPSPWDHKESDTIEYTYSRTQSWTPEPTLCNCSLGKELDMRWLLPSQNYMGYSNSWLPSWLLLEKPDLLERISEQYIFIFYSKTLGKKLIIIVNRPQVVNY